MNNWSDESCLITLRYSYHVQTQLKGDKKWCDTGFQADDQDSLQRLVILLNSTTNSTCRRSYRGVKKTHRQEDTTTVIKDCE